jgi:hypothetical protein
MTGNQVPWQELMDAAHGMIGNAAQYFRKIAFLIQTIELGGAD